MSIGIEEIGGAPGHFEVLDPVSLEYRRGVLASDGDPFATLRKQMEQALSSDWQVHLCHVMRGNAMAAGWRTQKARSENLLMKSNPFAVSAT